MPNSFEQLVATYNPVNVEQSSSWLKDLAMKTTVTPSRLLTADRTRLTTMPMLGRMYLFQYDAKYKSTLPYYDRFPLVFPIASTKVTGKAKQGAGFYGINLHYLPLRLRARLMDQLYKTATNDKMDETTKLKISYKILDASSRLRFFRPCVKQYLIGHMKSKFFMINSNEWGTAVLLPLQRFVGASASTVWQESMARI
jgi:hypothetical protein